MLNIFDSLPKEILDCEAKDLVDLLSGPSLIHLPGRQQAPLFVSVLQHGNESTGFYAIQALLRQYQGRPLPRALSIFIGNVSAARDGVRRLEGQPDFNRIWPGCDCGDTPEHVMMAQVVSEMENRGVFASIDIHNNTGINPHYACINLIDHRYLHLATLFSRTVVYFTRPIGVQSLAFSPLCPAVTVECGQPGQMHGLEHAQQFIDACLHMSVIPIHPVAAHDIDLFRTVATVKVPDSCNFSFTRGADIDFVEDLDHLNFRELPQGTLLASHKGVSAVRLEAWDEQGKDVHDRYFDYRGNQIHTLRPLMLSMFTLDERVIRQDCLGYLMERYDRAHGSVDNSRLVNE